MHHETDWLDGYLARRLNQTSAFGAFLDPVADKLMIAAALIVLVQLQRADAIIAVVIIGREIAISAMREWMAKIGKSKSVAVQLPWKGQDHLPDDRGTHACFTTIRSAWVRCGSASALADLPGRHPHPWRRCSTTCSGPWHRARLETGAVLTEEGQVLKIRFDPRE